ncbi:hypothetical protein LPIBR_200004 [Lacticaseibacillus paracasei]|nr:hypothetical protein LPIBR_200004 [Lacticaseibacillus paracasei]
MGSSLWSIFKELWRRQQTVLSKSWQIDETYIRVEGCLTYLYRAMIVTVLPWILS